MIRTISYRYTQVTLFAYENELKLRNNQCFLLRLKTVFSNKLHFTYDSLHINDKYFQSAAIFSHYSVPVKNHSNFRNIRVTLC